MQFILSTWNANDSSKLHQGTETTWMLLLGVAFLGTVGGINVPLLYHNYNESQLKCPWNYGLRDIASPQCTLPSHTIKKHYKIIKTTKNRLAKGSLYVNAIEETCDWRAGTEGGAEWGEKKNWRLRVMESFKPFHKTPPQYWRSLFGAWQGQEESLPSSYSLIYKLLSSKFINL